MEGRVVKTRRRQRLSSRAKQSAAWDRLMRALRADFAGF